MHSIGRFARGIVCSIVVVILAAGSAVILASPASAATFAVTSANCLGPGSITQAVADANAHPGADIISFRPDLVVDAATCPNVADGGYRPDLYFLARVTESVVFEGNGARLQGQEYWLDESGQKGMGRCPTQAQGTIMVAETPGFLLVGTRLADNSAIHVEVNDLDMDQLNAIASVREQASLAITGSKMTNIARVRSCGAGLVEVFDANFSMVDSSITNSVTWGPETLFTGSAVIDATGRVDIVRSTLAGNTYSFAVRVFGQGNIVSSQLIDAGGIVNSGSGSMNLVNSTFFGSSSRSVDRIAQTGTGTTNVIASSISVETARCRAPACRLEDLSAFPFIPWRGTIHLAQSAVGVRYTTSAGSEVIETSGTVGTVTADPYTWIQPVTGQDATALRSLTGQAGLLVNAPGLLTNAFFADYVGSITPLLGTAGTPGVLIDAIPDAGTGGTNELKSPIDNTPITLDVFGHDRVDGSGRRTIGAVQQSFAPHLTVVVTGDGSVALAWSRPQDLPSTMISGYGVLYRPVGSSTWTRIDLTGDTTLGHEVTGLTGGTPYEFQVVAVAGGADGPPSNIVTATPLGPIGAPAVSAVPGEESVKIYWTAPSCGGRSGPNYYQVVYRQAGDNPWEVGPSYIIGRTTTIPGLTGNVAYEFGVFAACGNETQGDLGTAVATPTAPPDQVSPRFAG